MILDKVFHGILDQGAGCLVVYDEPQEDVSSGSSPDNLVKRLEDFTDLRARARTPALQKTYEVTLDTLKHVGNVIDSLYKKVRALLFCPFNSAFGSGADIEPELN